MNIEVGQLCRELVAGRDAGASGYDLLRWGAEPDFIAKVLNNSHLETSRDGLQSAAKELRGTDMPALPFRLFKLFEVVGDRLQFESQWKKRRKVLLVSALSVWLWGDLDDIATLEDCIWALCDDYTWSLPAHMHGASLSLTIDAITFRGHLTHAPTESATNLDLMACETGFALAQICALVGNKLHPFIVERARSEVMRRIIDSYMQKPTIQQWEIMDNNWCAVCAGSIGSAAMLLVEDDLKLAAIIRNLLPVLDRFLDSFSEGACMEGLLYWAYGVSYFVMFAELLSRRTIGKLDLLSDRRFAPIAAFQQHCFFPGGATLSFSDAQPGSKFRPGLACFLAERFQEVTVPPLESAEDVMRNDYYTFAPALFDMMWTTNTLVTKPSRPLPCVIYQKAQWLLCSGHNETGFAAKGGHNDEEHNHNDVGSFTFSKHGVMLLCDIGGGEYSKAYFGPRRYEILCTSSQGHNLPIIDEEGQCAGREYCARDVAFDHNGAVLMDIAPAYHHGGLTALLRHLSFDSKTGRLTLRDEIKVSRPVKVVERFVSLVQPRFENGAVMLGQGPASCKLLNETGQLPEIGRAEHINHRGESVNVYTIDFPLNLESNAIFNLVVI